MCTDVTHTSTIEWISPFQPAPRPLSNAGCVRTGGVRTRKISRKRFEKTVLNIGSSKFVPSAQQLSFIWEILDALPPIYLTWGEDGFWYNIGIGLHNWCKHPAVCDIFKKFSMKSTKYDENEINKLWMSTIGEDRRPILIATVIHYHQQEFPNYKHKRRYRILNHPVKYERLRGITWVSHLNIEKTNYRYVSQIMNDVNVNLLRDHKYIFITSPTGSGKTVLINRYFRDYPLIVLTSRRSLADTLQKALAVEGIRTLHHYEQIKKQSGATHPTLNEIFEIESLDCVNMNKLVEGEYVVVLDEFNSLIVQFFSQIKKMADNRLWFIIRFFQICLRAKKVVCTDYDLTTKTIKFFMDILTKIFLDCHTKYIETAESDSDSDSDDGLWEEMIVQEESAMLAIPDPEIVIPKGILIVNRYDDRDDTVCTFYEDRDVIINKMREDMENGIHFVCCSDRLGDFYRLIVLPFAKEFPGHKRLVYSSLNDSSADFPRVNEIWKDAWVFATPTLIYGTSYDNLHTHKVYYVSWGGNLNAMTINQQIGRVRHPKSIHVCVNMDYEPSLFSSKTEHLKYIRNLNLHMDLKIPFIDEENSPDMSTMIQAIRKIVVDIHYEDSTLKKHVSFHLTEFLKDRGIHDFRVNIEKTDQKNKMVGLGEWWNAQIAILTADGNEEVYARRRKLASTIGLKLDNQIVCTDILENLFTLYTIRNWERMNPTNNGVFHKNNTLETVLENQGIRLGIFIKLHEELSLEPLHVTAEDYKEIHRTADLDKKFAAKWKTTFRGRRACSDAMTMLSRMYRILLGNLCKTIRITNTDRFEWVTNEDGVKENKKFKGNGNLLKFNILDWDKVNNSFQEPIKKSLFSEETDVISWLNRNYTIIYKNGTIDRSVLVPIKDIWEDYRRFAKEKCITILKKDFIKQIEENVTYGILYSKDRIRCDDDTQTRGYLLGIGKSE